MFSTTRTDKRIFITGFVTCQGEQYHIIKFEQKRHFGPPTHSSAQAWGCLVMASVLVKFLPSMNSTECTFYVNSKTTKSKLLNTISTNKTPNKCYGAEWEVYCKAAKMLQKLPTAITIIPDEVAAQLEEWAENADTTTQHLAYEKGSIQGFDEPYLMIQNKRVSTEYSYTIKYVSTAPPCIQYLSDKYSWSTKTINTIHWDAHEKALSQIVRTPTKNNNSVYTSVAPRQRLSLQNVYRHCQTMSLLQQ